MTPVESQSRRRRGWLGRLRRARRHVLREPALSIPEHRWRLLSATRLTHVSPVALRPRLATGVLFRGPAPRRSDGNRSLDASARRGSPCALVDGCSPARRPRRNGPFVRFVPSSGTAGAAGMVQSGGVCSSSRYDHLWAANRDREDYLWCGSATMLPPCTLTCRGPRARRRASLSPRVVPVAALVHGPPTPLSGTSRRANGRRRDVRRLVPERRAEPRDEAFRRDLALRTEGRILRQPAAEPLPTRPHHARADSLPAR